MIRRKVTEEEKQSLRYLKHVATSSLQSEAIMLSIKKLWLDEMRSKKVRPDKIMQKNEKI